MKVTVIDYGLSNLLSVRHAFAHFGAETLLTSDPADVLAAEKLVLPGVGAFKDGMDAQAWQIAIQFSLYYAPFYRLIRLSPNTGPCSRRVFLIKPQVQK